MSFSPLDSSLPTTIPTRGTSLSAGADIYSTHQTVIPARGVAVISTNLMLSFRELTAGQPNHLYYAEICGRSSSYARGFIVHRGIIDQDYEGELAVRVENVRDEPLTIAAHVAIAQVIIKECILPLDTLKIMRARRGAEGFGSTDCKDSGLTSMYKIFK